MDYKKILEDVVDIINTTEKSDIGFANICTYIGENCPELKESEDDRIRKVLVDYFKRYKEQEECGIKTFYGIPTDNIIAWLEKQKEFVSADFDDVWETADCEELTAPLDKYSKDAIKNMCHAWYDKGIELERRNWLEKQGEQNDSGVKDYNSIDPHFGKSIDKAEPKFHEGQWIVWQGKNFKVNYNGCGYELTDQNGKSTSLEYGAIDETANLWTIQDAKAGDVLATGQGNIFIFKSISDCVVCDYCGLYYGKFMDCSANVNSPKSAPIGFHPATKEQCEQLEKAMADAGYTFDFEKKELKKIENEIEIPFGAKDSELIEESYYIPKGFHAEIDGDKVVIKKGEKPTTWSDEDEYKTEKMLGWLNTLINYIQGDATVSLDLYRERKQQVEQIKTWLKSLKDRHTWKPSDEQMEAFEHFVRGIGENGYASPYENNTKLLYSLLEQLKKLK